MSLDESILFSFSFVVEHVDHGLSAHVRLDRAVVSLEIRILNITLHCSDDVLVVVLLLASHLLLSLLLVEVVNSIANTQSKRNNQSK